MLPKKEEIKIKDELSVSNFRSYIKTAERKSKKKMLVVPKALKYKESSIIPRTKATGKIQFFFVLMAESITNRKTKGKETRLPCKINKDAAGTTIIGLISGFLSQKLSKFLRNQ